MLSCIQILTPLEGSLSLFSLLYAMGQLLFFLGFPLAVLEYESLHLLKIVKIIYKRATPFKHSQIWLYFILTYYENIFCAVSILLCVNSTQQSISIVCFHLIKMILLRKCIKKIELLRNLLVLFFFSLVAFSSMFPNWSQTILFKNIMLWSLLAVLMV